MKNLTFKIKSHYFILLIFILSINFLQGQTDTEFNIISEKIEGIYNDPGGINYILDEKDNDDDNNDNLNDNGSFKSIDYTKNNTETWKHHLNLTLLLARGFRFSQTNTYSRRVEFMEAYFKAIRYFLDNEPELPKKDDWYTHIGFPTLVSRGHFLMSNFTYTRDLALFRALDIYMERTFRNRKIRYGHVSDIIQSIEPLFIFCILKKNKDNLTVLMEETSKQLQIVKPWEVFIDNGNKDDNVYRTSGIEPDYSFTVHNVVIDSDKTKVARQIYNGGYGHVFIDNMSKLFYYTNNTSIQINNLAYETFSNFLVDGFQWTFFNKISDNSVIGRNNISTNTPYTTDTFQLYNSLTPPRSSEISNILERIHNGKTDTNYLEGNKYFWRSDMMIHRRKDYYFSVKMTSDRTVAPETDKSTTNFYAGAGVTHLMKTGDEYTNGYSSEFNSRKFPGTTVEQDTNPLPIEHDNWGYGGENNNPFAGGITNGKLGACGMIWEKRNVTAHKSWFMFDNEIIALGAGIKQENGINNVATTINQSSKKVDVIYKEETGSDQNAQGNINFGGSNKLEWVFHDNVGYFPLSDNNYEIDINNTTNIFSIGINHGTNPSNETYAYLIKPNIEFNDMNNTSKPFEIIQNTSEIQAIYHSESDVVQAVFYEEGELNIPAWGNNTTITVNEPSILMVTRNLIDETYNFTISNPYGENSETRFKEITFKKDYTRLRLEGEDNENDVSIISVGRNENILSFDAWNSRWGGQSSREKTFKRECSVVAATTSDGNNLPYNTRDNSLFSRWSAYGNGEFIQYKLCDENPINYVAIAFYLGNERIPNFDISVSKNENAQDWETILSSSNDITYNLTNEKQHFYFNEKEGIKYIRYTGYGNDTSSWNSLTEFDWGNTSSKNQNTQKESIINPINITPNPILDRININSNKLFSEILIYSIEGKKIMTYNHLKTKNIQLDFSKYSKGIYLLNVIYQNGEYSSQKIIKE